MLPLGNVHIVHVTREEEDSYTVNEGELLGADMEEALVGDGEIDWDCPCLQGMAHGPCGEAFKTAFTCFVTSSADPKGSDCIENFVAMRDCMIANPKDYPDLANDAVADEAVSSSASEEPVTAETPAAAAAEEQPKEEQASA